MPLLIGKESSDPPSSKREKTEETTFCDDYDSGSDESDCGTPEERKLFYDEWDKNQGFETDFTKLAFCFEWQTLDLDDSTMIKEPETNRDLIVKLVNLALTDHNAKRNTNLKLAKVVRANFHPSAGVTFYISFQVNDPSEDGNQTKPYRAVVRYLTGDIEVRSCMPKPSY